MATTLPSPDLMVGQYVLPAPARPFLCGLCDAWVLYYPLTDRLLVLNATAKSVWDLFSRGCEPGEITAVFARKFGISDEQARRDVAPVLADLTSSDSAIGDEHTIDNARACAAPKGIPDATTFDRLPCHDLGVYCFGRSRIRVLSQVAEVDASLFARFHQRSVGDDRGAEVLEVARGKSAYRLTLSGQVIAEPATINQTLSRLVEVLLSLEHPQQPLLAYCHSAALVRGGHSLLMPGRSGVGKSTLTAFLVAHGFAYLGDDTIAIGEGKMAVLPLPTRLSIKSGAWAILQPFYPMLPELPILHRYGRSMRYVEPQNHDALQAAAAASVIVFPAYTAGQPTRLTQVSPLQTMIQLLGAHARLSSPASEVKLAQLIRFVEQTPAYELSYSELPAAMKAIEGLLVSQT